MRHSLLIIPLIFFVKATTVSAQLTTLDIQEKHFTVRDTSGAVIELNDLLHGNNVLVVNFWATWCAPCRKEIPNLVEIFNKRNGDGLTVMGFCTEPLEANREKVAAFIKKHSISYPIYFVSKEVYHYLTATLGDSPIYLPRLILFNRQGILAYQFDKWHGPRSKQEHREAIEQLLQERE